MLQPVLSSAFNGHCGWSVMTWCRTLRSEVGCCRLQFLFPNMGHGAMALRHLLQRKNHSPVFRCWMIKLRLRIAALTICIIEGKCPSNLVSYLRKLANFWRFSYLFIDLEWGSFKITKTLAPFSWVCHQVTRPDKNTLNPLYSSGSQMKRYVIKVSGECPVIMEWSF